MQEGKVEEEVKIPMSSNLWAKVAVTSRGGKGQGAPSSSSTMLSKSLLKTSIR